MKSLKIVLITLFVSSCLPVFGIFLNPSLLGTKKDAWYDSVLNSNLANENTNSFLEFSTEKPKKEFIRPEKCSICKDALQLKKDWVRIQPCKHIVHARCAVESTISNNLLQFYQKQSPAAPQCVTCNQNFNIKNIRFSKDNINALPLELKISLESALNRAPVLPDYQIESNAKLAKKSAVTTLSVFGLFASQSKLPWYLQKIAPFPIGWLERNYGLSSSPFNTSSKFTVQYWGKLLYTTVSEIIPTYVVHKKLPTHIWNYMVNAYSTRNYPNSLPSINL